MDILRKNRRQRGDVVVKAKNLFVMMSWMLLFSVIVLLGLAKPQFTTMFERIYENSYNFSISGPWNNVYLNYSFILLVPLALVGIIGLMINSLRHRRKSDTYSISLIVSIILSAVGLSVFIILGL